MLEKIFGSSINDKRQSSYHTVLNNRFVLNIPADWTDKSIYKFDGPQDDGINHNIFVHIENNVEIPDLERYADIQIKAVETELQGYHELKRGRIVLNNQLPAYELVYKWSPMKDREVYQRAIYVLHKETGYILTATFSKKTWKTKGTEIDKILKSFTVP